MMLASCASAVAASSLVMSVATAMLAITSAKPSKSSWAMPNCPPASTKAAISVAARGMRVLISWMASPMAATSVSLMPVVFCTPAMALSNSTEASTHAFRPSQICCRPFLIMSAESTPFMVSTQPRDDLSSLSVSSAASLASLPYASMDFAHWSALLRASSRYLSFWDNSRFS